MSITIGPANTNSDVKLSRHVCLTPVCAPGGGGGACCRAASASLASAALIHGAAACENVPASIQRQQLDLRHEMATKMKYVCKGFGRTIRGVDMVRAEVLDEDLHVGVAELGEQRVQRVNPRSASKQRH